MKGLYAIFRKETANFFVSPIAYAVGYLLADFRLLLLGKRVVRNLVNQAITIR
jgi:hypothetical protein